MRLDPGAAPPGSAMLDALEEAKSLTTGPSGSGLQSTADMGSGRANACRWPPKPTNFVARGWSGIQGSPDFASAAPSTATCNPTRTLAPSSGATPYALMCPIGPTDLGRSF